LSQVRSDSVTSDAFLGGRLIVGQPKKGFRAGTDSVLLGAAVDARRAEQGGPLMDLGAGAGVAGLVALTHFDALEATFIEIDPVTAGLCQANIKGNGFADRARVIELDIIAPGPVRMAAGMPQNHFATVLANPPFYRQDAVTRPANPGAATAHAHKEGALLQWVKTACGAAAADAEVIFVYPAGRLDRLLEAFGARLGDLVILPVAPFAGARAARVLVRGVKGSRAPMNLLPPLVLHEDTSGRFCPKVDQVLQGKALLDW
jgi:tRNA1(Val) A37 N6-methylase TrmN6